MSDYPDLRLYIDGAWRTTGDALPVVDPATEEVIGSVPVAGPGDLDDAVKAAVSGFEAWRVTPPSERAEVICRAADLMRDRQEEIAESITLEHGKPLVEARAEVVRGAEFFEWDAGEAVRTYGRVIPSGPGVRITVHHQPIGPVAAFSPWNFPFSQPARKVAGALASGCSIVLKAAEETPAGALHIARAFHDAGLPPGVLNLVFGVPDEISRRLIADEAIRRGIWVEVIDAEAGEMKMSHGGRSVITRESLSEYTSAVAMSRCDDKRLTRRIVSEAGIAVPRGRLATFDQADHDFLLKGDVFTEDLIGTWIDYKRTEEADQVRLRPHPWEFSLYYDV